MKNEEYTKYVILNFKEFNNTLINNEYAKKHLHKRGINNFDLFGYDNVKKLYVILYETNTEKRIINYKPDRKIKYLFQKGTKKIYPFNFINIKNTESIWITKGIFDALYLTQNHSKQAIAILQHKILPETIKLLKNFKEIIFAFDNIDEKKTQNGKNDSIRMLIDNGIKNIKYIDYKKINFKYKDINDAFQAYDYDQISIFLSSGALKAVMINDIFTNFYKFIINKQNKEKNIAKKYLGYELSIFKELCKNIDGIQNGLYLIASAPNVGKTSFLINILLDLIITNSQKNLIKENILGIFISLDDTKNIIINRIISYLSEIKINHVKKNMNNMEIKKIEIAYDTLLKLVEKNLLIIFDNEDITNIKILEDNVKEAFNENKNLVVFIDGLQNITTGIEDIRKAHIYIANKIKELSNKYEIPILATIEILKGSQNNHELCFSDIMESGKYCYNASVVWFLSENKKEEFSSNYTYLNLHYSKNKLSDYKGHQSLKFIIEYSKIYEIPFIERNFRKNKKINNIIGRINK